MDTKLAFLALMAFVAVERLVEMFVSRRNEAWSMARGGVEAPGDRFGRMVAMHTSFLFAAPAEVFLFDRAFVPSVGWASLAVVVGTMTLRYWVISTLGPRWNTKVIYVPGLPRVANGPFAWFPHPNYVAVVLEIFALPMVHNAWLTAILFSAANAVVLADRISLEERFIRENAGA